MEAQTGDEDAFEGEYLMDGRRNYTTRPVEEEVYIPGDVWSGKTAGGLNVSLPHHGYLSYRLPFVAGQRNASHEVELTHHRVHVPRSLELVGNGQDPLAGVWKLLMADTEQSVPSLFHGRVIYKRGGKKNAHYMFFDNETQQWLIDDVLRPASPQAIATFDDGALLPVDSALHWLGSQGGVQWQRQGEEASGLDAVLRPDADADAAELLYSVVSALPRGEGAPPADFEEGAAFPPPEAPAAELLAHAHGRPVAHFLTHPSSLAYHTFAQRHPFFDHKEMVRNPLPWLFEHELDSFDDVSHLSPWD